MSKLYREKSLKNVVDSGYLVEQIHTQKSSPISFHFLATRFESSKTFSFFLPQQSRLASRKVCINFHFKACDNKTNESWIHEPQKAGKINFFLFLHSLLLLCGTKKKKWTKKGKPKEMKKNLRLEGKEENNFRRE